MTRAGREERLRPTRATADMAVDAGYRRYADVMPYRSSPFLS
jgi:hypothetical protein